MNELNHLVSTIALTLGAGWASGINLYAAVLTLGILQSTGYAHLPPDLQVVADPLVMGAAGLMYCVEFFADKTPGVDTGWDALHTFIRLPAGAALAAAAVGDMPPAVQIAAALVGGTLAAGSHAVKSGSRVLINTSPEPFSNWTASIAEDAAVIMGLWAALNHPVLFLALLVAFVAVAVWLIPRLWRGVRRVLRAIARFFGGGSAPTSAGGGSVGGRTRSPTLPPPDGDG